MMNTNITGDSNTVNNTDVVVVHQRRDIGFFGAFFLFVIVAGLVAKFWVPVLIAVAVGMV